MCCAYSGTFNMRYTRTRYHYVVNDIYVKIIRPEPRRQKLRQVECAILVALLIGPSQQRLSVFQAFGDKSKWNDPS